MSDMVTFVEKNRPPGGIRIRQVGDDPEIVFEVDFEKRQQPSPEDFDKVGTAEVKLAVLGSFLPDELSEECQEALEAVQRLKVSMADYRGIEGDDRQDLMMGNLDALPEVEKRE